MIIALYVDDLILAGNEQCEIRWIESKHSEIIETKQIDEAMYCLGIQVSQFRPEHKLSLTQTKLAMYTVCVPRWQIVVQQAWK